MTPKERRDCWPTVFSTTTQLGKFDGIGWLSYGTNDPGHTLEYMYKPESTRNTSKVNDPVLNGRIDAIQSEFNEDKRRQMILDIQPYLMEKMYYVPAPYYAGPIWEAEHSFVMDSDKNRTVRSGAATQQLSNVWLDK